VERSVEQFPSDCVPKGEPLGSGAVYFFVGWKVGIVVAGRVGCKQHSDEQARESSRLALTVPFAHSKAPGLPRFTSCHFPIKVNRKHPVCYSPQVVEPLSTRLLPGYPLSTTPGFLFKSLAVALLNCSNRGMHSLLIWLMIRVRHCVRTLVMALCVLTFVLATTETGTTWWNIARGCLLGLFFGMVFAFGDELADLLEGGPSSPTDQTSVDHPQSDSGDRWHEKCPHRRDSAEER
jgi:hypothetical protein